jgi:hypothetical protein
VDENKESALEEAAKSPYVVENIEDVREARQHGLRH